MSRSPVSLAFDRLSQALGAKVKKDVPLAGMTTLGVGGPASVFAAIDSLRELRLVLEVAHELGVPTRVIGRGSNVLVSDSGFPGIVYQLGADFRRVTVQAQDVVAGGAVNLATLVQTALRHSLSGVEWAIGIPGTVGGAVAGNAGAFGSDMGSVVQQLVTYSVYSGLVSRDHSQLSFAYRSSSLDSGSVIVEARLRLRSGSTRDIKLDMERNFRRRRKHQPLNLPNAGSVFLNPDGLSAGELVEAAGCKGWREGGAAISELHANFIVNEGGATAADVYRLIRRVQKAVVEKQGITLRPEIKMVGVFE